MAARSLVRPLRVPVASFRGSGFCSRSSASAFGSLPSGVVVIIARLMAVRRSELPIEPLSSDGTTVSFRIRNTFTTTDGATAADVYAGVELGRSPVCAFAGPPRSPARSPSRTPTAA